MQIITHHRHAVNLAQAERIASAVGGGILTVAGLARRSPAGIALALVGGDLLRRAISGHSYAYEAMGIRTAPRGQGRQISVPYELGVRVDETIAIARPRPEIYRFWRSLTNLPRFMRNLESVTETGAGRTHWVVRAPAGRTVAWDAIVHNDIENERIAWRSLEGADVDHAGSVSFRDVPGGGGTEMRVELQYDPPAGTMGAIFAAMFGREPSRQIREDLHRLKALLEAGGVPAVQEQPVGDSVEESSEESFPASDAPAFNP